MPATSAMGPSPACQVSGSQTKKADIPLYRSPGQELPTVRTLGLAHKHVRLSFRDAKGDHLAASSNAMHLAAWPAVRARLSAAIARAAPRYRASMPRPDRRQ